MLQLIVAAVKDCETPQSSDGVWQLGDLVLSDAEVGQVDQITQLTLHLLDPVEPKKVDNSY